MPIPHERAPFDAPASIDTGYCFVPNADGSFSSASKNNKFTGSLSSKYDADWIIIELQAGKTYTFTLEGDGKGAGGDTDTLEDPILMLLDAKGGLVMENDDIMAVRSLESHLMFTPPQDGKYHLSVSAFTGNPGQANAGSYTLTVQERPAGPADVLGHDDEADKLVGTDGGEKIESYGGNDVIDAGAGDDDIDAGEDNDLITGGAGADMIDGGDDNDGEWVNEDAGFYNTGGDTVSYRYSTEGQQVTINLRGGLASGGHAEGDVLENIENVIGAMNAMNMLTGDRGDNYLEGGSMMDVLLGDRGDDQLIGHGGDDELEGGDGNDILNGGGGADTLTGGDGDDWASYSHSAMGVTVRLHARTAMGGDAEGDEWGDLVTVEYDNPDPEASAGERVLEETVPDIIHLIGSGNSDRLAGDSRANHIRGGGGDDAVYGGPGGGNDMLWGEGGHDRIFGGLGDDTMWGGGGNDLLSGGPGDDKSYGGMGSDMIYATVAGNGEVNDSVINGDDPDPDGDGALTGNDPRATDTVSFDKVKRGVHTGENNELEGDSVTPDADDAPFTLGTHATNIENIIGSSYDDSLRGDSGNNLIEGGDGADYLDGGSGDGGNPDSDTVSYENSDRDVTIELNDTAGTAGIAIGGHAQGDVIINFENVTGSRDYGDELRGNTGANILKGLGGDDEIAGGAGSDTIEGGAGADELDGGTSTASADNATDDGVDTEPDTLSYATSDAGVSVNLSVNTVSGGHAEGDEIAVQRGVYDHDGDNDAETDALDVSTFESVIGSMYDDRLTGDHRDNTLNGHAGNDTLRGLAGMDILIGGPGADSLDGGEDKGEDRENTVPGATEGGRDSASQDFASYETSMAAGVTVDLDARKGTGGDAMGDTYRNIEAYKGSPNGDTFIAGEGADVIDAGMEGANGDNTKDTISYEQSETGVKINLQEILSRAAADEDEEYVIGGAVDADNADDPNAHDENDMNFAVGDMLEGFENVTGSQFADTLTALETGSTLRGLGGNDDLNGAAGGDTLMGGAGRDMLDGGDGNDTVVGGAGDDVMTGGGGNNTFVFSPNDGAGSVDVITDFGSEGSRSDAIDLSAFGLDPEDLLANISVVTAGDNDLEVRIDLRDFDGGIIILEGVSDLAAVIENPGTPEAMLHEYDTKLGTDTEAFDTGDGGFIL